MNRIISLIFIPSALLMLFSASLFAQSSDKTLYLKIDYLKVQPQQITEYIHVKQELWNPIHQARVDNDIILGWNFYSVFVGEPDAPYNYITVNVFDDFNKIDYYGLNELISQVYPDKDLDEFYEQTRSSHEVVRTEIWQVDGVIHDDDTAIPNGNYITKNFFDARSGTGEHAAMELDFWGGIHEVRVDQDILNGWAMYTLYYPEGDVRHYTYSTIDYYEKLEHLTIGAGMELARIAHPEMDDEELSDYFNRTGASRSLFKTEIWKLKDSVGYD